MKVVLDTNVWLSGVFWRGEAYALIGALQEKGVEIVITRDILEEIRAVVTKEAKFQRFILDKKNAVRDLLRTILSVSALVVVNKRVRVVKSDPADDKILEAACAGGAAYVISYDHDLLRLREFSGIRIVLPAEWKKIANVWQ